MTGSLILDIFSGLISLVHTLGYWGIFLGMVVESSFIPFPSEVVLIPAGTLIASGKMTFFLVFIFALAGTVGGALVNFFLARYLGRNLVNLYVRKYGKFLFITNSKLKKIDLFFKNHGEVTSFVGRLIPFVRQWISLPAGFSKMNVFKFIIYTALGAGIWTAFLIYMGYLLGGRMDLVVAYSGQMSLAFVIISIVIIVAYFIAIKKNKK